MRTVLLLENEQGRRSIAFADAVRDAGITPDETIYVFAGRHEFLQILPVQEIPSLVAIADCGCCKLAERSRDLQGWAAEVAGANAGVCVKRIEAARVELSRLVVARLVAEELGQDLTDINTRIEEVKGALL